MSVTRGAAIKPPSPAWSALGGALVRTERWEAASLGRFGVSVAPRPRGGAVALSVRF